MKKIKDAKKIIADFSENDVHPFYNKYLSQDNVKPINWEDCSLVPDNYEKRKYLSKGL